METARNFLENNVGARRYIVEFCSFDLGAAAAECGPYCSDTIRIGTNLDNANLSSLELIANQHVACFSIRAKTLRDSSACRRARD